MSLTWSATPMGRVRLAASALLAILAACSAHSSIPDSRLLDAANTPADWVTHGGTYAEQRYSGLDQINTTNANQLGLAWSTEFDTARGQETTPLIVDGRIYLTTAWSKVMALDGRTGRTLWQYDPQVPGDKAVDGCCDVVNRGAAWFDGKIYVGTFDGRLVALDAENGKPVWSVNTVEADKPYTITGAPRVFKGLVLIGNGGADLGVRGYVTAYDARTGAKKWRFYTVPRADGKPDGEVSDEVLAAKAASTWSDGAWKQTGGGGTVWDAIVYDPELDQVYIGVGNGTPWSHDLRSGGKGDNLFLASVVALDAATGAYKWHYQHTPGESWDFTSTQPIMLADLVIGGRNRKVLMQAPKNGFFYVIDRKDGTLISAEPFAKVTWATSIDMRTGRPVEDPRARYRDDEFLLYPSAFGAHTWFPMSFSPRTGLVYLPVQEVPMFYRRDGAFSVRSGTFNTGLWSPDRGVPTDKAGFAAVRASVTGALIAWDPVARREVWRAAQPGPSSAGTLATAGDVVFEGNQQGHFEAFDARNGKRLWRFQAPTSVIGSPVSYSIDGVQYVIVTAGAGGGFALSTPFLDDKRPKPNGRALAFRLGGTARLPAIAPAELPKAVVPRDSFTPEQVASGYRIFETTCAWCHGGGAVSGGVIPDLRRSFMLDNRDAWRAVVIDGALADRGMVSFSRNMDADGAEAVRAYVGSLSSALARNEAAH
jgi:quinohemoprotein ethanol dehydrogenase